MATLNINGRRVKVDDSFLQLSPEDQQKTVEEIARSIGVEKQADAPQQAQPQEQMDPYQARAQEEAARLAPVTGGALQASSGGLSSGFLGNFDDEIGAVMTAPFRMAKDRVGPVEAYKREQALNMAIKGQQRADNPIASTAGQVAGGLALAGKAGQAGATTSGRIGTSTLARGAEGALEGMAYGTLYGAGDPGDKSRLRGAAEGAAIGGVTGGVLGAGSGALANRAATKAANQAAPTVAQLSDDAQRLYQAADAKGVMITQKAAKRMADNIEFIGGNPNARLRPNTLGIVKDAKAFAKGPMSIGRLDELRQNVNSALKTAAREGRANDERILMKIKDYVTNFADNMKPGEFTGDAKAANTILKGAREVWARKSKTELVESILDKADVKSSQFSQSGMANAIKTVMRQTYSNKATLSQFSKEEQALIRQMAKGGSDSAIINLLAKFAPRGVVSVLGSIGTTSIGGPIVGLGTMAGGMAAARSADRSAIQALEMLRRSAATGGLPQALPQIGRGANVLIAPATQQMQGVLP